MRQTLTQDKEQAVRELVRGGYAKIAVKIATGCGPPGADCCSDECCKS